MPSAPAEFELDGIRFEVRRLSVDDTCAGLELLAKAIGPLLQTEGDINWMAAVLGQASQIPKLLRLFAGYAKVSRAASGAFEAGGAMVDLKAFVNDVFAGEQARMIAFLVKSVQAEYSDFLSKGAGLTALLDPTAKA